MRVFDSLIDAEKAIPEGYVAIGEVLGDGKIKITGCPVSDPCTSVFDEVAKSTGKTVIHHRNSDGG